MFAFIVAIAVVTLIMAIGFAFIIGMLFYYGVILGITFLFCSVVQLVVSTVTGGRISWNITPNTMLIQVLISVALFAGWYFFPLTPGVVDEPVSRIEVASYETGIDWDVADEERIQDIMDVLHGFTVHRGSVKLMPEDVRDDAGFTLTLFDSEGGKLQTVHLYHKQYMGVETDDGFVYYSAYGQTLDTDSIVSILQQNQKEKTLDANEAQLQELHDSASFEDGVLTFTIPYWDMENGWDMSVRAVIPNPEWRGLKKDVKYTGEQSSVSPWREGMTVSIDFGDQTFYSMAFYVNIDGYKKSVDISDLLPDGMRA